MRIGQQFLFEEGELKIRWEDTYLTIPLNFDNMNEAVLYKVVRGMQNRMENLEKELKYIKKENETYIRYKFEVVTDLKARELILEYLKKIKSKTKEITIFEISQTLKLPADQVEKIIEDLENEEKVKWVET